jgi:hypothetical protein
MDRKQRAQVRQWEAELDAIADDVAAELGDWHEKALEPGQVVSLEERRARVS